MLAPSKPRQFGDLARASSVVSGSASRVQPGSGVQSIFSLDRGRRCGSTPEFTILQTQLLCACSFCFCCTRIHVLSSNCPKEPELVQPIVPTGRAVAINTFRAAGLPGGGTRGSVALVQAAFIRGAGPPAEQVMEQELLRKGSGGVLQLNCVSLSSYVETLIPSISEHDCFWRQDLEKDNKVKM